MTVDLRAFRFRHGLTQAELARAIGVGRTRVIELESRPFDTPLLIRLAISALAAGLEPYETTSEDVEALEMSAAMRIGDRRTVSFRESAELPNAVGIADRHEKRRRRGLQ